MHKDAQNAVILFVGGPEDGRIVMGAEAEGYAITLTEIPGTDGKHFSAAKASPGKTVKVGASRLVHSMHASIPPETVHQLYEKYGVSKLHQTMNKYRLDVVDGDVFVYRYVQE